MTQSPPEKETEELSSDRAIWGWFLCCSCLLHILSAAFLSLCSLFFLTSYLISPALRSQSISHYFIIIKKRKDDLIPQLSCYRIEPISSFEIEDVVDRREERMDLESWQRPTVFQNQESQYYCEYTRWITLHRLCFLFRDESERILVKRITQSYSEKIRWS